MLVNGAALRGHIGPQRGQGSFLPDSAAGEEKLGRAQAAGDQIVKDAAPRGFAFPSHVAHRQQQLLPVAAHAEDNQQRDWRGWPGSCRPGQRQCNRRAGQACWDGDERAASYPGVVVADATLAESISDSHPRPYEFLTQ